MKQAFNLLDHFRYVFWIISGLQGECTNNLPNSILFLLQSIFSSIDQPLKSPQNNIQERIEKLAKKSHFDARDTRYCQSHQHSNCVDDLEPH